jgi:Mg-chelatase subunit ChlD
MELDQLKNRDYVLVIDKSGSMATEDCANHKSRWKAAQESTQAIANRCNEYDPDGITIIPFASSFRVYENTTPDKVATIFASESPMGSTNLTPVLENVFESYLRDKRAGKTKPNGVMCLIVTDGQPDDEESVAKAIAKFTTQIDHREEFGLSFIQVGKDLHASKYLERLDSHLTDQGAKLDIVNTKTFEEVEKVGLEATLIAALTE